jgi:putative FmdB family regulatory protein
MPTYTYECSACGHRFEEFHSMTDERRRRCPRCRRRAKRVPAGGAGLLFKGSGFYITDYRSSSYRERAKKESGGGETKKKDSAGTGAKSGGSSE